MEWGRINPTMGRKRRVIGIENPAGWVFNRMAEVYDSRPVYPTELVDALVVLARGPRVVDLGAGTGHLALPLAARGLEVVAVEPAAAMLQVLERSAAERGLRVEAAHGKAEELPFDVARFDLVVISDALHFVDAELVGREVRRVLAPGGALAVVTCEFANTPFMTALRELMESAAPRRPRAISQAMRHLAALSDAPLHRAARFVDETPVEADQLESILRSISFIGPAMNPVRFEAFRERLHALPHAPVWAREFTLYQGRKSHKSWTAAPKRRG